MPHLLIDISSHGFGHLAQVAPVVEAIRGVCAGLRVSVRCNLPAAVVRSRIPEPERLLAQQTDIGMVMASAMSVRVADTHEAYRAFHRDWGRKVDAEAEVLAGLAPDVLLADVPYLSLAAAQVAQIPTVAFSSLNWADIYDSYCGRMPGAGRIIDEIKAPYADASLFIQATPHMPMTWIPRRVSVAPVAPSLAGDRAATRRRLGVADDTRLLLVALGGIDTPVPVDQWPSVDRGVWMVPGSWALTGAGIRPVPATETRFPDLLAASDLVVTKPGYGTFVEAAAAGTPVLVLDRPDWPETPYLIAWLDSQVPCATVDGNAPGKDALLARVHELLERGRGVPRDYTGAAEAAAQLHRMLAHNG
jgi:hypothetical protein